MESIEGIRNATESASDEEEDYVVILFEILVSICFFLGFILNAVLLVVFVRRRGFRSQISNRFVISLVLANLFSCLLLMPILLVGNLPTVTFQPDLRPFLCHASDVVVVVATAASLLSQVLIGVDQYVAILHPLQYHRNNSARYNALCLLVWAASVLFGLGLGLDSGLLPADRLDPTPFFATCQGQRQMSPAFGVVYFLCIYLAPILLLFVIYLRIFCAARRSSLRTRRNSSCSSTLDGLQHSNRQLSPQPPPQLLSRSLSNSARSTTSNLLQLTSTLRSSVKQKLSSASAIFVPRKREDTRAARLTALVLLMVFVCWTPYFALVLLHAYEAPSLQRWTNLLSLLLACSSTVFTPLLYAYRSKRVRRDVKRAFGLASPHQDLSRSRRIRNFLLGYSDDLAIFGFSRRQQQPGRMERAKSFSCPQLLISDEKGARRWFPSRKLGVVTPPDPRFGLELERSSIQFVPEVLPMMMPLSSSDEPRSTSCSCSSSGGESEELATTPACRDCSEETTDVL